MKIEISRKIKNPERQLIRNSIKHAAKEIPLPNYIKVVGLNHETAQGMFAEMENGTYRIEICLANHDDPLELLDTVYHELKHMSDAFLGRLVPLEKGFKYMGVYISWKLYTKAYALMPFEIAAQKFAKRMVRKIKKEL